MRGADTKFVAIWRSLLPRQPEPLDLTTDDPGHDVAYKVTPKADRYAIHWDVSDPRTTSSVGGDFSLASAGHWYGQGIAVTQQGGPYSDQPWPLDSGHVSDHQLGPFDYFVNDPFWFTQRGTGMWVDTDDVMFVDINSSANPGAYLIASERSAWRTSVAVIS